MLSFLLTAFLLNPTTVFPARAGLAPQDPIPLQTCYDFTGRPLTNNTQCPGSNACCYALHQCTDNLLCTQDDSDVYVNSLCAVNPWEGCSNICQYGANLYGYLPRVIKCQDGSYCCDSDSQCCAKHTGYFLDGKGNIVSRGSGVRDVSASTSISSSPVTTTGAATTLDATETSASVTSTSTPVSSLPEPGGPPNDTQRQGLTIAAKAGIGVSVSIGMLSICAIGVLYYRYRWRNPNRGAKEVSGSPIPPVPSEVHLVDSVPRYELHESYRAFEIEGDYPKRSKVVE